MLLLLLLLVVMLLLMMLGEAVDVDVVDVVMAVGWRLKRNGWQ